MVLVPMVMGMCHTQWGKHFVPEIYKRKLNPPKTFHEEDMGWVLTPTVRIRVNGDGPHRLGKIFRFGNAHKILTPGNPPQTE